jgi:S-adenosylmethionine hydrolase
MPEQEGSLINGCVLYVDTFGNLTTNISGAMLARCDGGRLEVRVLGAVIRGLSRAYSDVPAGALLAYVGSAGLLEIGVNRQSAATRLGAGVETPVSVSLPA